MKKYLLISISIFVLFSCKKDPVTPTPPVDNIDLHKYPGLPDATQSGLNTMGCLINGKPWVADVDGFVLKESQKPVYCTYGELRPKIASYDSLLFSTLFNQSLNWREDKARYEIQNSFNLQLKPIKKVGTYELKDMYQNKFEYWFDQIDEPIKIYEIDTAKPQYFEITKLDTIQNIISGVFDLKMKRISDSNDTIQITNGRFDGKYWQR